MTPRSWSRQDFLRRHAEALRTKRPMAPPAVRVTLAHEQEAA